MAKASASDVWQVACDQQALHDIPLPAVGMIQGSNQGRCVQGVESRCLSQGGALGINAVDATAIISGHLPATAGKMIHTVLGNMFGSLSDDRFAHPDRETIEGLFAQPMVA